MIRYSCSMTIWLIACSQLLAQREGPESPKVEEIPSGAVSRLGTLRFRTLWPLTSVSFSPDGKWIAAGGHTGEILIWNAASGTLEAKSLIFQRAINRLAFSANGRFIAASDPTGQLVVWNFESRTKSFATEAGRRQPLAFAWRPDGKAIYTIDTNGGVSMIEPEKGDQLRSWSIDEKGVVAIACSPDGKNLATFSTNGHMKAWSIETGKLGFTFDEVPPPPAAPMTPGERPLNPTPRPPRPAIRPTYAGNWHFGYSSNGQYLIAGGQDRQLVVWDAKTGKVARQFSTHFNTTQAFIAGGRFVACATNTGEVHIFGMATGQLLRTIQSGREPTMGLAASPNGELLAMVGYGPAVRVLNLNTETDLGGGKGHRNALTAMAFLGDSRRLVTTGQDSTFVVWDAASGRELERITRPEFNTANMAATLDGRGVLFGGGWPIVMQWTPGEKDVQYVNFIPPRGSPNLSHDGRLALQADAGSIRVFDLVGERELTRLTGMRGNINPNYFVSSAHGRFVAAFDSVARPPCIRVWNVADGKERIVLTWDNTQPFVPQRMTFSSDTRLLATIGSRREIRIWEATSGAIRFSLPPTNQFIYTAMMFSPDDRTLVLGTSQGALRLIDLATQADSGLIPAHQGEVRTLALSRDGKYLASGSADTTAVVWNLDEIMKRVPRRPMPANPDSEQFELWWSALGSNEPLRAGEAIESLRRFPAQSLELFKRRLEGVQAPDVKKILEWIQELDADKFAVRNKAFKNLQAVGEDARPLLQAAANRKSSPELQRRLKDLLKDFSFGVPARKLQPLRAIELLARIESPEARTVLAKLKATSTDEDIRTEIDWVLRKK